MYTYQVPIAGYMLLCVFTYTGENYSAYTFLTQQLSINNHTFFICCPILFFSNHCFLLQSETKLITIILKNIQEYITNDFFHFSE